MAKSPDAFRTISEVSAFLDTQPHVLRFWETKFEQLKPVKRAGGRRYYRPGDVALLLGIKSLLHEQGMTIRGVQKMLREQGARHVASLAAQVEGAGVIMGPWAGAPRSLAPEADLDEDLSLDGEGAFDGEFEDAEPEEDEALDGAPGPAPFEEDAEGPPAGSEAPTLIEAFLEGTLSRLAQEGSLPSASDDAAAEEEDADVPDLALPAPAPLPPRAKPTLGDALALLKRADPERLQAQASRIAPLVARLRALQAGLAAPRG